jgi:hypothetical protein
LGGWFDNGHRVEEVDSDYEGPVTDYSNLRREGDGYVSDRLYFTDNLEGPQFASPDVSQYEIVDEETEEEDEEDEEEEDTEEASSSEYDDSPDDEPHIRRKKITSYPTTSRQTRSKTATTEDLAVKAIAKIRRARERGSINVTLSHAEIDALERRRASASSSTSLPSSSRLITSAPRNVEDDDQDYPPKRSRRSKLKDKEPSRRQYRRTEDDRYNNSPSHSQSPRSGSRSHSRSAWTKRRHTPEGNSSFFSSSSFFSNSSSQPQSRRRRPRSPANDAIVPAGTVAQGYTPQILGRAPDGRPIYAMPMPMGYYAAPYGATSSTGRRVVSEPQAGASRGGATDNSRRRPVPVWSGSGSGEREKRSGRDRDR